MRYLAVVTCALLSALVLSAHPRVSQQPPPIFRGGVDVIPLDVLVLDGQRQPVRGLTAADFTVLESGKPQPIIAFFEVDVPDPVAPTAPWMRDVAPDVTSNDLQTRRLVLLVMDDAGTGIDEGEPIIAGKVARAVIDQLGPADLAAVVYTFLGRSQNFTADRAQLIAAVESFRPRNWGRAGRPTACMLRDGGCAVSALARIGEVLRTAPPGRKTLVYIGADTRFGSPEDEDAPNQIQAIQEMFQDLQLANASVYAFDPRGLRSDASPHRTT